MNARNETWGREFLQMTGTQGDVFACRFRDGSISEICVYLDADDQSKDRALPLDTY